MNKTKIEWVRNPDGTQGFTCNLVVGCNGENCEVRPYCFARTNARLHNAPKKERRCYLCYAFIPHTHFERMEQIRKRKKPAGIFLDSMGDWLDWQIDDMNVQQILDFVRENPQHRFYLLTKQATRLGNFRMPPNLWVGVSVNYYIDGWRIAELMKTNANVKFVSFEPLYGLINIHPYKFDWAIIGRQTHPYKQVKDLWLRSLIAQCREKAIPIFLKDNLEWSPQMQAFPKVN